MEIALFGNVKKLYENELYSCVIELGSMLSSLLMNDRKLATAEIEYQLLLFLGNSYYQERRYRLATKYFDSSLLMRQAMLRFKGGQLAAIESIYEHFCESEIYFRLATCYRDLNEPKMAITTLESLSTKIRTPKIHMLLAKLLHHNSSPKAGEAVYAYKDVLRDNPMSMGAINSLLELGIDGSEVNSLAINATSNPKHIEWLNTWIKAHALLYDRKHLEAARVFQSINENTKFHQNEYLMTMIGKCLYYYGSFPPAQNYLENVVLTNPYNIEAIMPLSVVYEYNQKLPELDKLASQYTNMNEFTSEHWFVLAQTIFASGKLEKASYFTHKAISVDPRNVEALLLRGKIFLQLKRHKDAIYFFRAAQGLASYRFEVYKGLFGCYIGLKRYKEAQTLCAMAVRNFRNSPRSYVMFARTLFYSSNPSAKQGAKKFVSKALEIDEHYSPAVALMAELCQAEGDTQQAIVLLKKQVVSYPHCKLFTMLGDILSAEKDLDGALEYYTIALSMEPTYHRALEGVNALGQASRSTAKQEDASLGPAAAQDEEWPIECDEPSIDAVEMSSPAAGNDDGESDTFSDPFWLDVDTELTN